MFARPWQVDADGSLHVTGGGDGDGWPWPYEVVARVTVEGPTLTCDYRLVNRSDGPMPAGIGLHPWFRRPVALRIPAEAVYPANTGSARDPIPVAGAHDLRVARVPDAGLDGTWTALAAPRIELAWAQDGMAASIEVRGGAHARRRRHARAPGCRGGGAADARRRTACGGWSMASRMPWPSFRRASR